MTKPEHQLPTSFAVGEWQIDGDRLSVSKGGTTNTLEPRAFKVLRYLAERPGRLVSIDELLDVHWQGTVVTPNAVTRIIAQIRKALDDDARQARYVETVARTGYRLIADVTIPRPRSRRPYAWLGAIGAAAIAVTTWVFLPDQLADRGVAVLPFENFTGDTSLDYIGDGVAQEIINSLSNVSEFTVTARSISFRFADSGLDARDFARELGVRYFVEGSVRRSGQSLRLSAQLIDTLNGNHVWSNTLERDLQELFDSQDEISRQLTLAFADELDVQVALSDESEQWRPVPEAYDLYLRGRHTWHRRSSESVEPAVLYFSEAVKIDPNFARGWAALASAYLSWPSYSPKGFRTWSDAESAAERALELDPTLAEPYSVLATFAQARREWREADRLFRESIERNDRNPTAHFWYSDHLVKLGYINESFLHLQRSMELDPLYQPPQLDIGWAHLMFGNPTVAVEYFDGAWHGGMRSMESWVGKYWALVGLHRYTEALEWLDHRPMPDGATDKHRRFIAELQDGAPSAQFADQIVAWNLDGLDHRDVILMLGFIGRFDAALDFVHRRTERGFWVDTMALWVAGPELRGQPGIGDTLNALGITAYWDEFGWGDNLWPRWGRDRVRCEKRQSRPAAAGALTTRRTRRCSSID